MATTATATARLATLGTIRIIGLIVAVIAAGIGVAWFVVAAIGPQVWWTSYPGTSGGQLVTLPLELRLINATTVLLWNLTTAGLALIVADLAWRVRRGVEFVPAVSRAAWALAIVLAAGSWLAQIVQNIAGQSGLIYPDFGDTATIDPLGLPIYWGIAPHTFIPNGAFLGLSIVLGVLAYIIQAGERLQRDTEGLV